jgi:hypothetical protein
MKRTLFEFFQFILFKEMKKKGREEGVEGK